MEGEWHTLHRTEEVSNLISFLREYETNNITRNTMRCNNCDDLLYLSFILKIPIFSEVYLPGETYMVQRVFFLRKSERYVETSCEIKRNPQQMEGKSRVTIN